MISVKRAVSLNDYAESNSAHKRLRSITSNELERFAVGSIIKIKVKNFVTYASTEFTLSPSLNMIIGPNGAGKSTFVCAACLGLGGHPTLLGRQKSLSGFIKNGEESANIEITLKNQPGKPNVIITRDIYQNNKSDWYINKKVSNETRVKQFLQSFNIQLDNLCQFLPQEKVADFAKSTPEQILLETERSIDINLLNQHKELISLDKEKMELINIYEGKKKEAETLEHERERYEEEAKKYIEFKKKKDELYMHEKLLPFAKMQDMKAEADRLKEVRDNVKHKLETFQQQAAPFDNALDEYERTLGLCINALHDRKRVQNEINERLEAHEKRLKKGDEKHHELLRAIENSKRAADDLRKKHKQTKADLDYYTGSRQQLEVPDEQSLQNLRNKMYALHDQKTDIQGEMSSKKDELDSLSNNIQRNISRISQNQEQFKSNDRIHLFTSERNRGNRLAQNTHKAIRLLRSEMREFRGTIFEPPCLTVSATAPEYAAFLEELLNFQTSLALTAISKKPYEDASNILLNNYGVNVGFRYLSNRNLQGDIPLDQLRRMGFDGYLRDFLKGPEPVIQMLSEQSYIHDIPVAIRPLSDAQIEELRRPKNGKLIFRKFFSGDTLYNLSMSRYGSRQVTVRTSTVNKKLTLFGSGGLSEEAKRQLRTSIEELKSENQDLESRKEPIEEEKRSIALRLEEVEEEYKELDITFQDANKAKKNAEKLDHRIEQLHQKLKDIEKEMNKDHSADIAKHQRRIKALLIDKIKNLSTLAADQVQFNEIAKEITLLEVRKFEEENKKISVKKLTKAFEEEKRELEQRYQDAKRKLQEYKNSDLRRELVQQISSYTAELKEELIEYINKYSEIQKFTESGILDMIESISSSLKLLGTSSKSSVNTLEKIIGNLETLHTDIEETGKVIETKEKLLKDIQQQWEPRLYELIGKISAKFSSIFPTVGIAGEIRIARADRFDQWRLEILVQFREEASLKVLDSQTQSGGERAVSTVYYMISLQELTSSPFRVVDEINQGMDARNERIVHKHMVETACQEHTSQYFLITPKLLTHLHYDKNMRIHCIMAGPWTPDTKENPDYLSLGTTSMYSI